MAVEKLKQFVLIWVVRPIGGLIVARTFVVIGKRLGFDLDLWLDQLWTKITSTPPAVADLLGWIVSGAVAAFAIFLIEKSRHRLHPLHPPRAGDLQVPDYPAPLPGGLPIITSSAVTADYSMNSGLVKIGQGKTEFRIKFSKASDTCIHLYTGGHDQPCNLIRIARIKNATPGKTIRFRDNDSSSRSYTINVGETFMAENEHGNFMQAKILEIKDDKRGAPNDEITFKYEYAEDGRSEFVAMN